MSPPTDKNNLSRKTAKTTAVIRKAAKFAAMMMSNSNDKALMNGNFLEHVYAVFGAGLSLHQGQWAIRCAESQNSLMAYQLILYHFIFNIYIGRLF